MFAICGSDEVLSATLRGPAVDHKTKFAHVGESYCTLFLPIMRPLFFCVALRLSSLCGQPPSFR